MKKIIGSVVLGAALLSSGVASAGGGRGVITEVMFLGNFAAVTITNASAGPSCHTGGAGQYAIDITTSSGKAMLSAIEGAQIAGRSVGIGGSSSPTGCFTMQPGLAVQQLSIITVY